MKKQKLGRRARRSFTPEFKADAVRLVRARKTPPQVAKGLDLTETALREWVKRADADAGIGSPGVLTTEEHHEHSTAVDGSAWLRFFSWTRWKCQ